MKLGLGQSYDKVEYLPLKVRAYIDLIKPASSVGVGLGYFVASLFYFAYESSIYAAQQEFFTIVYVSLTMFLAHSASQAMNQATDAEMDANTPHKKNRPIPSGIVSEDEARALAWILAAFALGRGFMVNWRFGFFTAVLLVFGIYYNLEPLRVKERISAIPWQAVSRGLLTFPAVWAAFGDPLALEAWALGGFLFLYVLAFQNTADIIDRKVDEEYGIRTWVVEYGVDGVVTIASVLTAAMILWVTVVVFLGVLETRFFWLLLVVPLCLRMLQVMSDRPEDVSSTTGNHPAYLWFYMVLVLIVSIPLVVEIAHA